MKLKIGFLAMLCAFLSAGAQERDTIKERKIGDKVPDLLLTGLVNYPSGQARLSDFSGKLLVLDFWATWCGPCIGMIPRMDALQAQYKDKVQFMPVAYQSAAELAVFYGKLDKRNGPHLALPEVAGDILLAQLFPHQTLPHYVWINKGVVAALTDQEAVNAVNIEKVLAGGALTVRMKEEQNVSYDRSKPLFFNGAGLLEQAVSRFSGPMPEVGRGIYKDVDFQNGGPFSRITARNLTPLELYQLAYRKEKKETVLEVARPGELSPEGLSGGGFLDWLKSGHGTCYELVLPGDSAATAYGHMQNDLRVHFPAYRALVRRRQMDCLALVRTSGEDKLHTRGGEPSATIDAFGAKFISCYLSVLISRLKTTLQGEPQPLVDLTGYKDMADIEITGNMQDLEAVNRELAAYDLKFLVRPAELEVLVIQDTGK